MIDAHRGVDTARSSLLIKNRLRNYQQMKIEEGVYIKGKIKKSNVYYTMFIQSLIYDD